MRVRACVCILCVCVRDSVCVRACRRVNVCVCARVGYACGCVYVGWKGVAVCECFMSHKKRPIKQQPLLGFQVLARSAW